MFYHIKKVALVTLIFIPFLSVELSYGGENLREIFYLHSNFESLLNVSS